MNNKILCVDDEESILRGFQLNLRKDFELHLASDGVEGLEVFEEEGDFALVLSDMRMPRMNGAEMLAEIKKRDHEVSTILLTGHTDFESAMAAVNDGNVFRMLSKPCPPERLIKVLKDGLAQHDLIKSKRILLDMTLRGAVDALAESLSTAKPLFFGRVQRVRLLANKLADTLEMQDSWKVDIASVFSQIAYIGLPENITEDVYYKRKVPSPVKKLLAEFPQDTQKILDKIPGLEEIGEILNRVDVQPRFEENDNRNIRLYASILRVCLDFDYYEEQGHDKQLILSSLKSRPNDYDPKIIRLLELSVASSERSTKLEELPAKQLETGMRLVEELRLKDGFLLASAGSYIDEQLYKVVRNYLSCYDENPFPSRIKVRVPR
jgi:CheY-like chemotaxis protein